MNNKNAIDIIAPAGIEINSNYLTIGSELAKTFFIFSYPRYLSSGWFSQIVNLAEMMDVSIFYHPFDTALALKNLRKKVTEVEAQLSEREDKGLIRDPALETAYKDIEQLRDDLMQAQQRLFQVGVYITIYGDNLENLNRLENIAVNLLEGKLVYVKPALFQQIEGFSSVLPLAQDKLQVHTPMNSGPASSLFPFISPDLSSDEGIMYGINLSNNGLILFDRFSLQNANLTIFATSGSGKSYFSKLEVLRSLMTGTNVIVIDPENEYQNLSQVVGGSYFKISLTSPSHVNPFDIPIIPQGEDPADVFKSHILNLTGLIKLMVGKIKPNEEAILDQTITETYASRDIVPGKDFSKIQPPLLQDLQTVLYNTEGGREMAQRLDRFTKGSYSGFVNKPSNVDIGNRLIVFSIRDLEDELRPIAMYVILNFIWNLIRAELKKRILVVDEAWWMMKYKDSAAFMFSLVKRARKYYLGVTTITQDIADFINSDYGRPIVTNSALQLLLRQAPATIDVVAKTFNLTEGEKTFLLQTGVGEGLFFAGLKHTAIKIVASYSEDQVITTNPEQILETYDYGGTR